MSRVLVLIRRSNVIRSIRQQRQTSGQEEDAHEREGLMQVSLVGRLQQVCKRTIMVRVLRPLVSMRNRVGMVETT